MKNALCLFIKLLSKPGIFSSGKAHCEAKSGVSREVNEYRANNVTQPEGKRRRYGNKFIISFALWGLAYAGTINEYPHLIGSAAQGKIKSQVCSSCHQSDGNSLTPLYPKLAGQNAKYLVKQLYDFKKGAEGGRNNPTMFGITSPLSQQDIADVASYFNQQKPTIGDTPQQYVSLGERIYRGGLLAKDVPACSSCHSPTGSGISQAGYPQLSGQYAEYTINQLQAFKAGQRTNGPNGIMGAIAQKMSEDEIKAVAYYVQGLH